MPHWDTTISLGTVLAIATFAFMFYGANRGWAAAAREAKEARLASEKDLNWRVTNLETWRTEQIEGLKARAVLDERFQNAVTDFKLAIATLNTKLAAMDKEEERRHFRKYPQGKD